MKHNSSERNVTYQLDNEYELNSAITPFVFHMEFKNFGLLWIIDNNKIIQFEMDAQDRQGMDKSTWYNTTICTKLNDRIFEDDLKTGHKDRYELVFSVDKYGKENTSMNDDAISGGGRPITSTPSKESLLSLGSTIKSIEDWLQ